MGLFSAFKQAFHHPVDVNLISDKRFSFTETVLPLRLELINKDKKQDIIATSIITKLERTEQSKTGTSDTYSPEMMLQTEQPVQITIPMTGETAYFDYSVASSFSAGLGEFAQTTAPDNPIAQGMASMLGKLGQVNAVLDMNKDYSYLLSIDVIDAQGTVVGFEHTQVFLLRPGEQQLGTTLST